MSVSLGKPPFFQLSLDEAVATPEHLVCVVFTQHNAKHKHKLIFCVSCRCCFWQIQCV